MLPLRFVRGLLLVVPVLGVARCGGGEPSSEPTATGAPPGAQPGESWTGFHEIAHPEALAQLATLEELLASGQDGPKLRVELGRVLHQLGRHREAREHLDLAIEQDPSKHAAWYQRGRLSFTEERYVEALADHERASELSPRFALARLEAGRTLLRLNRLEEAEASFEKARELRPEGAEPAFQLALLRLDRAPEEAEALLRVAVAGNPQHLGAAMNLARVLRRAGKNDEALVWMERHRELSLLDDLGVLDEPESLRRYVLEARYFLNNGRPAEALESARAGRERFPDSPDLAQLEGAALGGEEASAQ